MRDSDRAADGASHERYGDDGITRIDEAGRSQMSRKASPALQATASLTVESSRRRFSGARCGQLRSARVTILRFVSTEAALAA
jgi:hypothetical protein